MFILMIIRGIPESKDPQWGCFEKDQAEALVALGHKVVCLSVDGRFRTYWRRLGATHKEINGVEYYNWFLMPEKPIMMINRNLCDNYEYTCAHILFRKIIAKYGLPDVIYAQWCSNMVLGLKLKAIYNIPVVGIEHRSVFGDGALYTKTLYLLKQGNVAFNNVDKLITVSANLRNGIKRDFGVDSIVIHNLVGGDFAFVEPKPHDGFNFVSVGSLIYRKGFDIIIDALNLLKDKLNIVINIIGEGGERANLQKKIDDYGLTDNVKLLGSMQKSQIVDIMRGSDAFIFASRQETFGVAPLEALMTGLPLVATDVGALADMVTEQNGVLVDVDNVDKTVEAMQYMVDNIGQYDRRLIANDAQLRYSAESVARKITQVLGSVVNKNK